MFIGYDKKGGALYAKLLEAYREQGKPKRNYSDTFPPPIMRTPWTKACGVLSRAFFISKHGIQPAALSLCAD